MTHSSFQESERLSLLQLREALSGYLLQSAVLYFVLKYTMACSMEIRGVFLPPHEQCSTHIFPLHFLYVSFLGMGEIRFPKKLASFLYFL